MKNKGIKRFFSLIIAFAMMFTMIMPIGVAYAVGAISTVSTVANAAVDPSIVVTLAGDTFTVAGTSENTANWTITPGTTGLVVNTITRNTNTQATIAFTGTALAGTVAIQANAAALTLGAASNSINVAIPAAISTVSTIANAAAAPSIVVTLVGDTFTAALTSENTANWTIGVGTTGLTVSTITRNTNTQATIAFTGPALAGTVAVQAKVAALSAGVASNLINVAVTEISTVSTIANAAVDPSIVVTLVGDTFTAALTSEDTANWTITVGTTGLAVNTITRDSNTQATIDFTGTSLAGTVSVQAKAAALTGNAASNSINVGIAGISTVSTIANGAVNPPIVVTLAGDTFTAAGVSQLPGSWTITVGTTGLAVNTITRDSNTQATITFTGTAAAGTVAVQAKAAALTGAGLSNSINVGVAGITTVSTIANGAVNPPIVVTLAGDTFTAAGVSQLPASWTINLGATGLVVNTITRDSNTQATITFTGTAAAGTVAVQAKAAALTGAGLSNSMNVVVPVVTISTVSTIANGAVAPSIVLTLANANLSAAVVSQLPANWTIGLGTTGLTVGTITRTDATHATITFTGTAGAGTITVRAKAAAHTGTGLSNQISVVVPSVVTISTASTVAYGASAPSIDVTLVNDTFTAAGTSQIPANWIITPGVTGLAVGTITRTDATHARITFTGTATAGTIAVQAQAAALTGGVASNSIDVVVQGAVTITSDPLNDAQGVPVSQVITLTTNVPSTIVGTITLIDGTGPVTLKPLLQSDNEISCIPLAMLSGGKTYTLTVPGGALTDSGGNPNELFTLSFTTAHNFNALINDPVTLNTLIANNSPRGLNVSVPKRYLTKFEIAYSTNSTFPLTNVDITAEAEVAFINVTFGTTGTTNPAVKRATGWNTGYQGTLTTLDDSGKPIGQDIVFEALDINGRLLEKKKVIKLNVKGNKLDLAATRSLTVPRTFADLILNNGKVLTDILKQYTLDELSLSVAPTP